MTPKQLKPGQLITYRKKVYRVTKQVNGCEGCALNSVFLCPNVGFKISTRIWPKVDCYTHNVIFRNV